MPSHFFRNSAKRCGKVKAALPHAVPVVQEVYITTLHFLAPKVVFDRVIPRLRIGQVRVLVLDKHLDVGLVDESPVLTLEQSVSRLYADLGKFARKYLGLRISVEVHWAITDALQRVLPHIPTTPGIIYVPVSRLGNESYTVVDIDIDVVKELEQYARSSPPSIDEIRDLAVRAVELILSEAYLSLPLESVVNIVRSVGPQVLILSNVSLRHVHRVYTAFKQYLELPDPVLVQYDEEENKILYIELTEEDLAKIEKTASEP